MNEKSIVHLGAAGVWMMFMACCVTAAFVVGAPGWFGPTRPDLKPKKEQVQ